MKIDEALIWLRQTRRAFKDKGIGQHEALSVAIEALEKYSRSEKQNKWILCSDRLPNEEECNVYDMKHPCYRQFFCTIKIGDYEPQTRQLYLSPVFGWKYGPSDYNEYVTAWMTIPEPYKPITDK